MCLKCFETTVKVVVLLLLLLSTISTMGKEQELQKYALCTHLKYLSVLVSVSLYMRISLSIQFNSIYHQRQQLQQQSNY